MTGRQDHMQLYKKWGWVFHSLFWTFFGLLSFSIYQVILENKTHALIPTIINLIGLIIMVYFHLRFLLPRYFSQKKYVAYAFGVLAVLILTSCFRFYVGKGFVLYFNLDYGKYFTPSFFGTLIVTGTFLLVLTMPLYLIENWFKRIELELALKTQQLESELRFLKAQVNPHFLFNALNNIYSLAFTQSSKAPEMILKLSEMMSYMLYECKSDRVKLAAEIGYLRNYIDLQQLKKEGEQNITFRISGNAGSLEISPMIFIPFLENAFKHGNLDDTKNGWLKCHIEIEESTIEFTISNSKGSTILSKTQGGVGLENIEKRLALIYPGSHSLKVENENLIFSAILSLNLENQKNDLPMSASG